ncbi:cytochrome-c peroxidase [Paracoccus sp. (in: a-proteobacteria)]|uniref:cytochrome-c peroxidase n=1 Tax=Paracoccus sp. TaxID=267 RepID=UPI0026DF1032|nr:cytochrome-c peroxidase [Paracoccus sp. (in: a-proteobacteria)]MDO5648660.1 cytochrome-c peroxidase [Paracoccus sp. (in: a-proteobacteria)]
MKASFLAILAVLGAAGIPAMADTDTAALRESAAALFQPIPDELTEITKPDGTTYALTDELVELGKALFFDPRMSRSQLISCHTCHNMGLGGGDGLSVSVGHGWQKGPRNAPTMLNAVFNIAQFWDGRAADLAEQAKGPVQASVEMSNDPDHLVKTIASMPGYVDMFQAAFPGNNDPITFDNFAHAVEAFEATLITPNSAFDQFLNGDDTAMNEQEKRGLAAFIDTGCVACHAGVNVGGEGYFPFGVVAKPGAEILPDGDKGRFEVTQTAGDEYVFRAAPLRNIALTAPYFHSGIVWDLKEAVQVMSSSQIGTELTAEQVDDITAFLHTLTGEHPEIVVPELPLRTADTPLPEPAYIAK